MAGLEGLIDGMNASTRASKTSFVVAVCYGAGIAGPFAVATLQAVAFSYFMTEKVLCSLSLESSPILSHSHHPTTRILVAWVVSFNLN